MNEIALFRHFVLLLYLKMLYIHKKRCSDFHVTAFIAPKFTAREDKLISEFGNTGALANVYGGF